MSKHTRGPWVTEDVMSEHEHDICLDYQIPGQASPIVVASVYGGEEGDAINIAQADANARLIAAAPELLEIAKEYVLACPSCSGKGQRRHSFDQHLVDCRKCRHAREAIAKAGAA